MEKDSLVIYGDSGSGFKWPKQHLKGRIFSGFSVMKIASFKMEIIRFCI